MSSGTRTIRLTMAQALVRHLATQFIEIDGMAASACAAAALPSSAMAM